MLEFSIHARLLNIHETLNDWLTNLSVRISNRNSGITHNSNTLTHNRTCTVLRDSMSIFWNSVYECFFLLFFRVHSFILPLLRFVSLLLHLLYLLVDIGSTLTRIYRYKTWVNERTILNLLILGRDHVTMCRTQNFG